MNSAEAQRSFSGWSWRRFVQAMTAGAIAGFAFLVVPLVILPAALIVLWAVATPPRLAKLSGLLFGAGATVIVVLVWADLRCAAQNAPPSSSCVPPDLTGFFIGGAVLAFVGVVLIAVGPIQRRQLRP